MPKGNSRQTEAAAQNEATRLLRESGVLTRRRNADETTGRGWPDVDYIGNGRCVHCEWKKPGGQLSPAQRSVARELRRFGMTVLVGVGRDDVQRIVAAVKDEIINGVRAASPDEEFIEAGDGA